MTLDFYPWDEILYSGLCHTVRYVLYSAGIYCRSAILSVRWWLVRVFATVSKSLKEYLAVEILIILSKPAYNMLVLSD
jgi:hypothetical protein